MLLIRFELRKIWCNSLFLTILIILLFANSTLFYFECRSGSSEPQAYMTLCRELLPLSFSEKKEFIGDKLKEAFALSQIDYYLKAEAHLTNKEKARYTEYIREYGAIYESDSYELYTDSFVEETVFLSEIYEEIELISEYNVYLEGIRNNADAISSVSLFQNDYSQKVVENTLKAYDALESAEVDYFPQKGFSLVLTFRISDIFILFIIMAVANIMSRSEKDNGLEDYIRCYPSGRAKTLLAKTAALLISSVVIVAVAYCMNFAVSGFQFGIGDLSVKIQSLSFLRKSTLPISIFFYSALYFFIKLLSVFLIGMIGMVFFSFFKSAFNSWLCIISVVLFELLLYLKPIATGSWGFLKCLNIFFALDPNDVIGDYYLINFYGTPVPQSLLSTAFEAVLLVILTVLYIYGRRASITSVQKAAAASKNFRRKTRSLIKEETVKNLLYQPAAVVFVLTACFQCITLIYWDNSYIDADEIYFQYYMKQVSGAYTEDKKLLLEKEYSDFEEIIKKDDEYEQGRISDLQYEMFQLENYSLYKRYEAFLEVCAKVRTAQEQSRDAVYEKGYEELFRIASQSSLKQECLLAGIIISVCFASTFSYDRQTGVYDIIKCTPKGYTDVFRYRVVITTLSTIILMLIINIPNIIKVAVNYGLPSLSSSANCLSFLSDLPACFSLLVFAALTYVAKALGYVLISFICLLISDTTNNVPLSLLLSVLIHMLPIIVSEFGYENLLFVSAYPLFSVSHYISTYGFGLSLVMVLFYIVLTAYMYQLLKNHYRVNQK